MLNIPSSTIDRFWSKVEKTDTCWLWTAGASRGYGQFHPKPGEPRWRAHRFAYELSVGPIPDGLVLDHLCRVTLCVNPDHLEPVTQRVNVLRGDSVAARAAVVTHCPSGHPYDDENTLLKKAGYRRCRTCQNEQNRAYAARMRARAKV